jgi:hypothetical protein
MPGIRFDPFFPEERLDDFHRSFGWDDSLNVDKSVLHALSGTLYGYPFIFGELKKMEWGKETYSGELRIHWTERERDSKGDYHTVSHSQTLTAHVTEPIPVYSTEKMLIYGNDGPKNFFFHGCHRNTPGWVRAFIRLERNMSSKNYANMNKF